MGIKISNKEEIKAYFDSEALNQSSLKKLDKGLQAYLKALNAESTVSRSMTIGGAVDALLTGKPGEFETSYYVSSLSTKPSEVECAIIEELYNNVKGNIAFEQDVDISLFKDQLAVVIALHEWQPRWKPETKVNKIIELGSPYFDELCLSQGKTILTDTEYETVVNVVTRYKESLTTKEYFDRGAYIGVENTHMYYQLPIYFDFEGVPCKALLDLVRVTELADKLIVEPMDIKTMHGSVIDFKYNFKKYGYAIQAAWYRIALQHMFKKDLTKPTKEVVIKLFKFLVASTTYQEPVMVYTVDEEGAMVARLGRSAVFVDNTLIKYPVKGIDQLMNDYLYYQKEGWTIDRMIASTDAEMHIGWDNTWK